MITFAVLKQKNANEHNKKTTRLVSNLRNNIS